MTLTVAEADAILALKKETAKRMEWLLKPNKSGARWYQYDTACKIDNEIREDVYFRATWRGEYPVTINERTIWKSEYIACGIFASANRIFSIDYSDSFHSNKSNTGLPYAGQKIRGVHIHKWTEYKDKYAEPLQLTNISLEAIINELSIRSNTIITNGFVSPPSEQFPLF
ncbi:hypothetical protein [Snodgrassella communis]|uniref:hypothetical protein n=1 Tax=Snodgrassella communis TaxID=2946699 RepID=UPI00286AE746|nr:hypothetical protein [Snodgrassella communis]MCO6506226.1 hypothetical protein [Snodgrassella sp.]WMY91907.1 hypothetical protein PYG29_00525 [Snodgrassella communis]